MVKIVKQHEVLIKESMTLLIYGFPGLGKTSLSQTANKALLLDFDNGVERAVNRQDVMKISSWNDVVDLMNQNIIVSEGYKTVIIDTVGTALDDYLAAYVMTQEPKNKKKGGGLSLAGYGALKDVYKIFHDYLKSLNINIILIAHLTEKQEGDDSVLRPKITGGTYDILVAKCDEMGYMYVAPNGTRHIEFQPMNNAVGKDAAGIGNIEFPDYRKPEYDGFMQREVIEKALDAIKSRNESAMEFKRLIDEEKEKIDKIKSVDEINQRIEIVGDYEHPEGVITQMKYALKNKAESLGFVFNKDQKKYEENKD